MLFAYDVLKNNVAVAMFSKKQAYLIRFSFFYSKPVALYLFWPMDQHKKIFGGALCSADAL